MLELISVVALAAIGVAFTSYQGERDSSAVARGSALEDADEQIQSVGIFGHDVGRRLRDRIRQIGGQEETSGTASAEAADEADGLAARLSATLDRHGDRSGDRDRLAEDRVADKEFSLSPERTEALIAEAMQDDEAIDPELLSAEAPALGEDGFEAPLEEAWASSLDAPQPAAAEAAAPEFAARSALAGLETAPVISDFDPARDQIVLEYRPEDAGSGRVGIVTDDSRPGAALITLGGRVVAVVDGGAGKVSAKHVELVQEAPRGKTAAA